MFKFSVSFAICGVGVVFIIKISGLGNVSSLVLCHAWN